MGEGEERASITPRLPSHSFPSPLDPNTRLNTPISVTNTCTSNNTTKPYQIRFSGTQLTTHHIYGHTNQKIGPLYIYACPDCRQWTLSSELQSAECRQHKSWSR